MLPWLLCTICSSAARLLCWPAGPLAPSLAALAQLLVASARALAARAGEVGAQGAVAAAAPTARKLAQCLVRLGEVAEGNALAKAYGVL